MVDPLHWRHDPTLTGRLAALRVGGRAGARVLADDVRSERGQGAVRVVDLGGGSTEIVVSRRGVIEHVDSLPLGAVRLTERFGEFRKPVPAQAVAA